jgi:hypothetical protein
MMQAISSSPVLAHRKQLGATGDHAVRDWRVPGRESNLGTPYPTAQIL